MRKITLEDYGLGRPGSLAPGFLYPPHPGEANGQSEYGPNGPWFEVLRQFPDLTKEEGAVLRAVNALPEFIFDEGRYKDGDPDDPNLFGDRRMLATLTSGIVNFSGFKREETVTLPAKLAKPFVRLSKMADLPPILNYADYSAGNWTITKEGQDGIPHSGESNGVPQVDTQAMLHKDGKFNGNFRHSYIHFGFNPDRPAEPPVIKRRFQKPDGTWMTVVDDRRESLSNLVEPLKSIATDDKLSEMEKLKQGVSALPGVVSEVAQKLGPTVKNAVRNSFSVKGIAEEEKHVHLDHIIPGDLSQEERLTRFKHALTEKLEFERLTIDTDLPKSDDDDFQPAVSTINADMIRLTYPFHGNENETGFILIHVMIEAIAAKALEAIPRILDAGAAFHAATTDEERMRQRDIVLQNLGVISSTLEEMMAMFYLQPAVTEVHAYEQEVTPFIQGWTKRQRPGGVIYQGEYNNEPQYLRGETGAMSSILPSLDALFDVQMPTDSYKEFRAHMPKNHRRFIEDVREAAKEIDLEKIVGFTADGREGAMADTLHTHAAMRDMHHINALIYLSGKRDVGTGGTYINWYLGGNRVATTAYAKKKDVEGK